MSQSFSEVLLPPRLDQVGLLRFEADLNVALAADQPLVLTGKAPGVFCTGLDIEHQAIDLPLARGFAILLTRVWEAPMPTLALIDGPAIGGGLGLAAACDRVLCTPNATFALPELLWGFVPAMIWPLVIARLGNAEARWWILTGHARTAEQAQASGLVDEMVSVSDLSKVLNRRIRECRRADRTGIPLLRRLSCGDISRAIVAGAEVTVERMKEPTVQQRLQLFASGEAPW